MLPGFASLDQRNVHGAHAEAEPYSLACSSSRTNLKNLGSRELRLLDAFASCDEGIGHGVRDVLGARCPFEVVESIVHRIAVEMIGLSSVCRSAESLKYKSVDETWGRNASARKAHLVAATVSGRVGFEDTTNLGPTVARVSSDPSKIRDRVLRVGRYLSPSFVVVHVNKRNTVS